MHSGALFPLPSVRVGQSYWVVGDAKTSHMGFPGAMHDAGRLRGFLSPGGPGSQVGSRAQVLE